MKKFHCCNFFGECGSIMIYYIIKIELLYGDHNIEEILLPNESRAGFFGMACS